MCALNKCFVVLTDQRRNWKWLNSILNTQKKHMHRERRMYAGAWNQLAMEWNERCAISPASFVLDSFKQKKAKNSTNQKQQNRNEIVLKNECFSSICTHMWFTTSFKNLSSSCSSFICPIYYHTSVFVVSFLVSFPRYFFLLSVWLVPNQSFHEFIKISDDLTFRFCNDL